MVYYSELTGKPIFDSKMRKISAVRDFCFVDGARYANISGILCFIGGIKKIISWKYVLEVGNYIHEFNGDRKEKKDKERIFPFGIYLNCEIEKIKFSEFSVNEAVLNNLIDKQLIDINGARIIRVNDVLLGKIGNKFAVVGVDVSAKGIARRLGFAKFMPHMHEHIILWKDVAPVAKDMKNLKLKVKKERINKMHPADIADMIRDLNLEEKVLVFNTLSKEKAAVTLLKSQPEIQKSVFRTLSFRKLASLLETLPNDEAAALLDLMPTIQNEKVLGQMKPGISARIKKILNYRERTAGSLMSTKFLSIPENLSIKQAIVLIRKELPNPRHVSYIYIRDKEGTLKGFISLRDLIISRQRQKISEIIKKDIITVHENTDIDEVFNLMSKYGLLALPVIDKQKKILGIIRANDILELMIPERIKKQRIPKQNLRINKR